MVEHSFYTSFVIRVVVTCSQLVRLDTWIETEAISAGTQFFKKLLFVFGRFKATDMPALSLRIRKGDYHTKTTVLVVWGSE